MQSVEQLRRIYSNREHPVQLCSYCFAQKSCRQFVIQFDTRDAGTIKLKDLYGVAVLYISNILM